MEYKHMIMNMGTLFLMLICLLVVPPLFLIFTKPCKSCFSWVAKNHVSIGNSFKGNMFIRFLLEGALDIAMCAALNFLYVEEGIAWDSTFQVVNSVTLIVLVSAIFIFPVLAIIFYCKNFEKWDEEDFEAKYGAVYEGLNTKRRSSLAYPMIFMGRRFVLVLLVTVVRDSLPIQVVTMVGFSVIQVAYLTTYRPFLNSLLLRLDVFNEFTTVILVDLLLVFSEANQEKFDLEADVFFLACLFGNLCVHIFFLMVNTVHGIKLSCKRQRARRTGCWKCCKRSVSASAKKYMIKGPLADHSLASPEKHNPVLQHELSIIDEHQSEENEVPASSERVPISSEMASDRREVVHDSELLEKSHSNDQSHYVANYDPQVDDRDKVPVDRQLSQDFERLMRQLDEMPKIKFFMANAA